MRISDKAIVLQSIKYGDKKLILKLFSKHNGLLTAAVTVGNSPSSKIKSGTIFPMNMLEVQMVKKENREIQRLTEAYCYYVNTTVQGSISKLSIAQFLNEILLYSIKEQAANAALFDFTEGCLKFLNESDEGYMNLHVYYLMELTKYLGIEPNNNYSGENSCFDCREGRFAAVSLSFPLGLDREDSQLFAEALKINCLTARFSNAQRQKLLDILLAYYQMHVPGFNRVKSLEVLREVTMA